MKILIAGIGGVGGYFGGRLAQKNHNNPNLDIYFLARGEHLKQIQQHGLKVINKTGETFTATPKLATDDVFQTGVADFILICTKGYDLEQTILQLKPCIAEHTIILPLLNGVDAKERIQQFLPETKILQGCVYIASHKKEAGVIENDGQFQKIFFGDGTTDNPSLIWLEKTMKEAGIDATYSKNILAVTWEKFIFISPIATATSFFNTSFGPLLKDHEPTVVQLIDEIIKVARSKGIETPEEIAEKTLNRLRLLPPENTSSMHRDFKANHQTELNSLTGYVVNQAKDLQVETPVYNKVYFQLLMKAKR
ncbi:MAG: 2-dehydropantoate 2-reductase [Sphingobacteriales bacterium]|nr:MAG: 2-dehydropantoate 2-reductase [Sphingobacteriales bacterium]